MGSNYTGKDREKILKTDQYKSLNVFILVKIGRVKLPIYRKS